MTTFGRIVSSSLVLFAAFVLVPDHGADVPADFLRGGLGAGGHHLRLDTARGPVYVWKPDGYDSRLAGIVVYLHGYYIGTEDAWQEHRLAEQFAASRRNAVFIVPETPSNDIDPVQWLELDELLAMVQERLDGPMPKGPLVVAGHSGAYRTMVAWTGHPRVRNFVLLDALYHGEGNFRRWLRDETEPRQMFMVSLETLDVSEKFARSIRGAVRLSRVPDRFEDFTQAQRRARLIEMKSQYDHMELIEGGKVLPLLLQLTPLPGL